MEKQWLAIYTKSRCEKKVHQTLQRIGIESYCPLRKTLRQWSDRKKQISQPLFTSYLFVRVTESERLKVLNIPGAIQFVFWLGKPAIIKDPEIAAIKQFLAEHPSANLENISYNSGDIVKVTYGPLKNCEGVVLNVRRSKVLLRLKTLGCQLMAEVHTSKIAGA